MYCHRQHRNRLTRYSAPRIVVLFTFHVWQLIENRCPTLFTAALSSQRDRLSCSSASSRAAGELLWDEIYQAVSRRHIALFANSCRLLVLRDSILGLLCSVLPPKAAAQRAENRWCCKLAKSSKSRKQHRVLRQQIPQDRPSAPDYHWSILSLHPRGYCASVRMWLAKRALRSTLCGTAGACQAWMTLSFCS